MESEGQRASTNPTAVLASLMSKRERLQEELDSVEKQVYELETSYLQDSSRFGNALKGSEGIFSSSKYTTNLKRSRKFHPEDRLFSLSSVTSPAVEERGVGRDDGRSDIGQGRSKGGGLPASGQGKLKRGRTAPRDGKRFRPSSDHGLGNDDNPGLILR
ncbi:chromatin modification-related protein eaf6-like isoform X1 [Malania oleifera]|uniref:chromatin modification-related protein eaf6-like isoform X1 n=1 Tax=Malania oleifera TaxID=397392 RepID=UPI0025AE9134|nr:chromatin modification-related protein eaf6-like isoform X1 [Malania oleifera]